jgi:hypothetical protein
MDVSSVGKVYVPKVRKRMRQRLAGGESFTVGDVHGAAGTAIPIPVALPRLASSDFSLLTIRGLPKTFALTSGFRFEDSWAVSLTDVERLSMLAPANYSGRFNLEIQLIHGQQQAPEKLIVPVNIKPVDAVGLIHPRPAFPRAGVSSSKKPPKVSAKEETAMMKRAARLLKTGDIAAARMLFERLARRGSANGAYAAGRTYDPEFLRSVRVIGLTPNLKKAKAWYARAADLGQPEAIKRLKRP